MTAVAQVKHAPSLEGRVSPEEWETRVDLAAAYRLVELYGMSDYTGTHISARVPGEEEHFLLNPYGWFFDEVTASSLIKVDIDGNVLEETDEIVNRAGYVIHSAVHAARPDIQCVLHTHTRAGMAVSAMECGLLPLTQHAMYFYNRMSYHDYEGVATNLDERERLVRDLGANKAMILRNHGLLLCGESVSEAMALTLRLEKSCAAQADAMAARTELHMVPQDVAARTAAFVEARGNFIGDLAWPAHLRRLDRIDPSFRL